MSVTSLPGRNAFFCLLTLALVWGACSDNDADPGSDAAGDAPVAMEGGGGSNDGGGGQLDTGGTKLDTGGTKLDTGGTVKLDTGGAASCTATICTSTTQCKSGEICLIPFWNHKKGLCTKKCSANGQCASAERAKCGLAQMCVSGSVTRGGTTTHWQACAYVCKDEFGKTYKCPTGTTCTVSNPNQSMCAAPP